MNTTLVLFKKNGKRKDIPITESQTIIGRQPDCNIRVLKSAVSRQHCKLVCEDQMVTVADLNSSNGTYLNNKRISTPTTVQPGDILSLANNIYFTITIDGKPQEIIPPDFILDSSED